MMHVCRVSTQFVERSTCFRQVILHISHHANLLGGDIKAFRIDRMWVSSVLDVNMQQIPSF